MVITSKIIKIKSADRYVKSTGFAIIGPQQSFYKEQVSEIRHLLTKYPKIDIVEKISDGRLVKLNLTNYDKDNNVKSKPVSVETPEQVIPDNENEPTDTEEPGVGVGAVDALNTSSEALSQHEPIDNNTNVETSESVVADGVDKEQKKNETPEEVIPDKVPDKQEESQTNAGNQQYTGNNKKNKNKNDQQQTNKSTEVTPEEPNM